MTELSLLDTKRLDNDESQFSGFLTLTALFLRVFMVLYGFRVWGVGLGVQGLCLGFMVYRGLGFRVTCIASTSRGGHVVHTT